MVALLALLSAQTEATAREIHYGAVSDVEIVAYRMEGDRANRFSLARLGAVRPSTDDSVLTGLIAERDALNEPGENRIAMRRASVTILQLR